jgi:hypothetical protein
MTLQLSICESLWVAINIFKYGSGDFLLTSATISKQIEGVGDSDAGLTSDTDFGWGADLKKYQFLIDLILAAVEK